MCRTQGFTEAFFRLGKPLSRIDCVAQFLCRQLLTGNVDDLEPIQLFPIRPFADVDHERIVQYLLFLLSSQIVERSVLNRKVSMNVLANADRSLLTVQKLKMLPSAFDPVHDIQGEIFLDRMNYFIALFILIDKFTLKCRSDVEFSAISHNAVLRTVKVSLHDGSNRDFLQLNLHDDTILLRIRIRGYVFFGIPFAPISTGVALRSL